MPFAEELSGLEAESYIGVIMCKVRYGKQKYKEGRGGTLFSPLSEGKPASGPDEIMQQGVIIFCKASLKSRPGGENMLSFPDWQ